MLSKEQRISRKYFSKIIKKGTSYQGKYISLTVYSDRQDTFPSKFAFVVSKKVASTAVMRNTLRRHGYDIIQKNKEHIRPNFWCVFFFKKNATELSYAEKEYAIIFLLQKANVYTKKA